MVRAYEPLYTVKEAAKLLRVNPQAVYRLINGKQLIALRLGLIKIRGSDLERFITSQRREVIRVAKLNFIQSQHPRMLSYVECRSDPVFYLVEDAPEPEPELDLDDLAGKVMFGICAMFAGCVASALLAGL